MEPAGRPEGQPDVQVRNAWFLGGHRGPWRSGEIIVISAGPGPAGGPVTTRRPAPGRRRRRAADRRVAVVAGDADARPASPRRTGSALIVSGASVEGLVDGAHRPGHGGVDVGDGLGRLDLADRGARGHLVTDGGQLHEDDVAERVLRVVGDPDPDDGRRARRCPAPAPTRAGRCSGGRQAWPCGESPGGRMASLQGPAASVRAVGGREVLLSRRSPGKRIEACRAAATRRRPRSRTA